MAQELFKRWSQYKDGKAASVKFLPKMDTSERCSSSLISTSVFGCLSESFLLKLNDLQLLGLARKFRKVICFLQHG